MRDDAAICVRDHGLVQMRVGQADGQGRYGMVDETADGLLCHECGRRFTHLGLHVFKAHDLTADEYRRVHGLSRRGLVTKDTAQTIAGNARRTMSRERFVQARDPAAASAAQRRGPSAISPAGLEAIRQAGRDRRGRYRSGTVVTCEWCGVEFCPLVAATRRRFCSKSCAARNNRRPRRVPLPDADAGRVAELTAVVQTGGAGHEHDLAALERAREAARALDAQVSEARRLATEQQSLATGLATQDAAVEAARELVGTAAVLVEAFRPSGIPSMVLAGVVDELNTEANTVMSATGDDGLGVRVSTTRTTAKGTTSEQVMVYATTTAGYVDYATLSGSEKFRVSLAVRLGLARCVARRTGTPVRTIVIDEGWGALDEPTRRGVATVLGRLAGQFGVLTVSHVDDVKDSFPHLVKVDAATGTSRAQVVAA